MQYQVLVQTLPGGMFSAFVMGIPNLVVEGASEEEALNKARSLIEERLVGGKLVTIEVARQRESDNGAPQLDTVALADLREQVTRMKGEIARYETMMAIFAADRQRTHTQIDELNRQVEILAAQLNQTGKVPEASLTPVAKPNPWLKVYGSLRDDPTFDDLMEEIAQYRQKTLPKFFFIWATRHRKNQLG